MAPLDVPHDLAIGPRRYHRTYAREVDASREYCLDFHSFNLAIARKLVSVGVYYFEILEMGNPGRHIDSP
jgi:hypothetical protein